jgi:MarR family transcriptional regulator, organic hydroperoxide resistance regulator
MSATTAESLRSAFIELMGAERRLRGRSPHREGDLSATEVRALFQLEGEPDMPAGCLAKQADVSPASMTAMLDHLEKDGMVSRRRSETDRRQVMVTLTDRGRRCLSAKREVWDTRWRELTERHSEAELATAAAVMHDIAALLDTLGR